MVPFSDTECFLPPFRQGDRACTSLPGFSKLSLCPRGFDFVQERFAQAGCDCSPRALCEHCRMVPRGKMRDPDLCQPVEIKRSDCFNNREMDIHRNAEGLVRYVWGYAITSLIFLRISLMQIPNEYRKSPSSVPHNRSVAVSL